jgi:hypothetical protein
MAVLLLLKLTTVVAALVAVSVAVPDVPDPTLIWPLASLKFALTAAQFAADNERPNTSVNKTGNRDLRKLICNMETSWVEW